MTLTRREVIEIAKNEVREAFAEDLPVEVGLEEFKRGKNESWLITVGFKRSRSIHDSIKNRVATAVGALPAYDPIGRVYKVVEIDPENGAVIAMTDRFFEAA